jgi:hypothetical protein
MTFSEFAESVGDYIEYEYFDLGRGKLSPEQKDTIFNIMRFQYDHGGCNVNEASGMIVEYLKENHETKKSN